MNKDWKDKATYFISAFSFPYAITGLKFQWMIGVLDYFCF